MSRKQPWFGRPRALAQVRTHCFTYSVADCRMGAIVATGRVTAIDGPHARLEIARKVVQELEKARAVQAAQSGRQ